MPIPLYVRMNLDSYKSNYTYTDLRNKQPAVAYTTKKDQDDQVD